MSHYTFSSGKLRILMVCRYNPVLGEFFRCSYFYPDGSEGYYLAEQVSHHPVSTVYAPTDTAIASVSLEYPVC